MWCANFKTVSKQSQSRSIAAIQPNKSSSAHKLYRFLFQMKKNPGKRNLSLTRIVGEMTF